MIKSILKGVAILMAFSAFVQKIEAQQVGKAGNPVLDGWYADPEGMIFDNKYWIYPTYSAAYEDQVYMDAFSSNDLVNWTKHSAVIDTSSVKWVYLTVSNFDFSAG